MKTYGMKTYDVHTLK